MPQIVASLHVQLDENKLATLLERSGAQIEVRFKKGGSKFITQLLPCDYANAQSPTGVLIHIPGVKMEHVKELLQSLPGD